MDRVDGKVFLRMPGRYRKTSITGDPLNDLLLTLHMDLHHQNTILIDQLSPVIESNMSGQLALLFDVRSVHGREGRVIRP